MDILRDIVEDNLFRLYLPELYEVVHDIDGIHRFLRSFDVYAQKGDGFLWGIWKNTFLIGFVAIMDMSYDPTIFYAIHCEYRNRGYAKEVVSEVVAHYKTLSKTPLHTEVYLLNHASLAVLSSCGFQITGSKDNKLILSLQMPG
jgi:RimJ/RimL family protein N-acetyltransferase